MPQLDLNHLTLIDAAQHMAEGAYTPLDLFDACLKRIDQLNPQLNAYIFRLSEEGREQAKFATQALERGENWGPLHGIPLGIKDIIDIEGAPTTSGSDFFRDDLALQDAIVVQKLRGAGAILNGKHNLHEFATGVTNVNPHFGPSRNPWDHSLSPGGSSGGSAAAVATAMCLAALGTDTGGSVRVPAALCGLTGLRPALGRISTQGVFPMSWTLDTVGPITRTVADTALLFDLLATPPGVSAARLDEPLKGFRIGIPDNAYIWLSAHLEVVMAVRAAIDQLVEIGMRPVELSLPDLDDVWQACGIISLTDAAAVHQERLQNEPERFGSDVRARLHKGQQNRGVDYVLAQRTRHKWRSSLKQTLREQVDVIALPTTEQVSLPIDDHDPLEAAAGFLKLTYPFGLSGFPCLSIPCGLTQNRLPIGLQLVALREETVLQVGHAFQQATNWHTLSPLEME
ncbi:MAG: amidase [Chloroflexi bacterium]|nr:amidase [Chloroflexota bacterium]